MPETSSARDEQREHLRTKTESGGVGIRVEKHKQSVQIDCPGQGALATIMG